MAAFNVVPGGSRRVASGLGRRAAVCQVLARRTIRRAAAGSSEVRLRGGTGPVRVRGVLITLCVTLAGVYLCCEPAASSSAASKSRADRHHAKGRTAHRLADDGSVGFSVSPGLWPAYDPAIPDYTVACAPSDTVAVHATVPAGDTVSIDGGAPLSGSVSQSLSLQPGQAFTFTVMDARGRDTHDVRCTPVGFPTWTVQRSGTPEAKWIIFTPQDGPYTVITDSYGVPIWWMKSPSGTAVNASVLPDGTVTWWNPGPLGDGEEGYYSLYDLDGTAAGTVTASTADGYGEVGANLHDLEQLPNGDYLLIAYVPQPLDTLASCGGPDHAGQLLDAVIQEVSPSGALLWSWNSSGHIGLDQLQWPFDKVLGYWDGQPACDYVHMNSIQLVQSDGCAIAPTAASPATCSIVFSARHLNAVYSISMATGEVQWKLGGTYVAGKSLLFVGDQRGEFSGQHFARVLANGMLTVFDDSTLEKLPPRAVEYRLWQGTATLVDQVTDPQVTHSSCCGSATLLPAGDWLIDWGSDTRITELTPSGAPVLTLTLAHGASYRAVPVTSTDVTRAALIAGMNAMFQSTQAAAANSLKSTA